MTIGNYPIGAAPIGGSPSDAEGLPSFPPTLVVTTWDPVASGPGMNLTNGNRQADGTDTAISTRGQNVDYVGDIVAEVDFTIDVLASPFPTYFGLATSAANTSQIPGSDVNGWAVKLEYVGKSGDESIIELYYRHNGVNSFVGDYLINNDLDDPILFFCVIKVGNGNLQLEVGTSQDETYPPGPVADIDVGTDNLQAGDVLYITSGYESDVVYLNGDNPAGFVNADDLYPAGLYWDSIGAAGVKLLTDFVLPLPFAVPTAAQLNIPLVNAQVFDFDIPLLFAPFVVDNFLMPLVLAAESVFNIPLGDGIPVADTFTMPLEYGNPPAGDVFRIPLTMIVESAFSMPLVDSVPAADMFDIPLVYGDPVNAVFDIPLTDGTSPPVEANLIIPLPILGEPPTIITDQPVLYVGNKRLEIASAELHSDNGSPYWQASIDLASPRDYGRFPRDTAITLDLFGTLYELIVDTRQLTRGMSPDGVPGDQASITALSPGAVFGSPRAKTISQSWTENVAASAAAQQALGAAIDWQLVDWVIPGFRFAVSDASPLSAARQIIVAVGGILLSRPDGTFLAQPEFPASPQDFATAPPAATLTEFDIFAAVETIAADVVINKIRVVDVETTFSDRLEFAADIDNPLRGIIRAYPSPWSDSVTFRDTAGTPVRVYAGAVEARQETEVIEIRAGRGAVRYPITSIDAVSYIQDNLGGVSFEPGTTDIYTADDDWSLLQITYTTRSIAALTESEITTQAQILLERMI